MARTTKAETFENEQLIRVYGSKTFFAVSPAPNIDKVKFSIVDIGSGGKDFIDIYLSTEEVRQFCADVDNGLAKKKIDADTGNYPTAYQWVRGENGAKRLIIGGGMKGVRIQATDASSGTTRKKMAVVQFNDLKELSFMFKLAYGLIPVQEGSYYEHLYRTFINNIGNHRSSVNYNDADDDATPVNAETEPAPIKPVESYNNTPEYEVITTVSCGEIQEAKNMKGVPVKIEETGEKTTLIFMDDQVENLSWFGSYEKKIAMKETKMVVKAYRKGKYYYFVDIAKK